MYTYTVTSFHGAGSTGTKAGPTGGPKHLVRLLDGRFRGVLQHGLNVTGTSTLVQAAHGTSAIYSWGTSYVTLSGNFTTDFVPDMVTSVREPGECAMILAGLGVVGLSSRRNRCSKKEA